MRSRACVAAHLAIVDSTTQRVLARASVSLQEQGGVYSSAFDRACRYARSNVRLSDTVGRANFKRIDTDGDGLISKNELVATIARCGHVAPPRVQHYCVFFA